VVTDGGRGMGTALFNAVADEARAESEAAPSHHDQRF
jgi:hypothetical protein